MATAATNEIVPSWLDKAFFESMLRESNHDDTITLESFEVKSGSKPGEHFASTFLRATLEYLSKKFKSEESKKVSVVIKTMPTNNVSVDLIQKSPAFKNEALMYSKILPEMERVLSAAGDSVRLGPK